MADSPLPNLALQREENADQPGNRQSPLSSADPRVLSTGWPQPLAEPAFYGLVGDFVRGVEEHTEADPAALLVQFLVAVGNMIGRTPHFTAEADKHPMNLFVGIVGASSRGRKGSSWGIVKRVARLADPEWTDGHIRTGLASGEGLIWAVRDSDSPPNERGVPHVNADPGVSDKRLLAYAPELAALLKVMTREGNTLSAVLRDAWDAGQLATLTKNSPATATNAHVSLIGHVTIEELRRYLSSTEICNGFANRFLWVCARRSRVLPEGGRLEDSRLEAIARRLADYLHVARGIGELARDDEAREKWCEVYPALTADRYGVLGSVTSRAEAHVMRLACLYALLDKSEVVGVRHLDAGLEVWRYCDASCALVFGDRLGNRLADELLQALRSRREGMTRDEIRNLFHRHRSSEEIDRALELLRRAGMVQRTLEKTAGRPATRWFVTPEAREGAVCAL